MRGVRRLKNQERKGGREQQGEESMERRGELGGESKKTEQGRG